MTNEQNEKELELDLETGQELTNEEIEAMEEIDMMDEITVVEHKEGFWKEHGATIGKTTGAVVSAAGIFTGGFFTGKYTEKKKRKLFMEEIENTITLIYANKKGDETVQTKNGTLSTAGYSVEDTEELIEVIQTKFLADKKIKAEEKLEWVELMTMLAGVGAFARTQEHIKGIEIIRKATDEENAKKESTKNNKNKKADE